MKTHNDAQLEKFIKFKQKYGEYVRGESQSYVV
jgi:hypothetical protein